MSLSSLKNHSEVAYMFATSIYLRAILQGRILMEMNYMLAYGSAEASLRLLWRFGLLEHLLPFQVNPWPRK